MWHALTGDHAVLGTPFLHAALSHANAVRLYEKLGFAVRWPVTFAAFVIEEGGEVRRKRGRVCRPG